MTGVGAEAALVGLGAVHGLNPGMGWLFAVALALQERSRRALWRALPPLALGHAGAIALALAVAAGLGHALPPRDCAGRWRSRWWDWACSAWCDTAIPAAAFASMGAISRSGRCSWPPRTGPESWSCRWCFRRAGRRPLTLPTPACCWPAWAPGLPAGWSATMLHTAGYLGVTMLAAVVVYERFGVGVLRRASVNLDLVWAGALHPDGGAHGGLLLIAGSRLGPPAAQVRFSFASRALKRG